MRRIFFLIIFLPSLLFGQTLIYRSVQFNLTTVIADLSTNAITISGSTLTATNALPDSIGVGDAVQYDSSNAGIVNAICFISGRTSSTVFTVKRFNGGVPASCTGDTDGDIFRAYTTVANWETRTENTGIAAAVVNFDAGTSRNIDTANEQWHVAIYGGNTAGGTITSTNWTTGTTTSEDYIRIYAPYLTTEVGTTQRHSGVYTTARVRIGFNAVGMGLTIQVGKSIIEGLQFDAAGTLAQYGIVFDGTVTGAVHTVRNCIIKGFGSGSSTNGIRITSANTATYYISNNIAYDWTAGQGFLSSAIGSTAYYYNNTSVDNASGFNCSGGTCTYKNDLSNGNSANDFDNAGTNSEYNASQDATAPGTNSRTSQTFTFVNEASNNFLLDAADVGAATFGKNLSADANLPITIDIINMTRTTPWDIGAHEVSSPAAPGGGGSVTARPWQGSWDGLGSSAWKRRP